MFLWFLCCFLDLGTFVGMRATVLAKNPTKRITATYAHRENSNISTHNITHQKQKKHWCSKVAKPYSSHHSPIQETESLAIVAIHQPSTIVTPTKNYSNIQ